MNQKLWSKKSETKLESVKPRPACDSCIMKNHLATQIEIFDAKCNFNQLWMKRSVSFCYFLCMVNKYSAGVCNRVQLFYKIIIILSYIHHFKTKRPQAVLLWNYYNLYFVVLLHWTCSYSVSQTHLTLSGNISTLGHKKFIFRKKNENRLLSKRAVSISIKSIWDKLWSIPTKHKNNK